MDYFYDLGRRVALAKFGGFLGRISPAVREAEHEMVQMMTRRLPSKAGKLAKPKPKPSPEELAKKTFLRGATGPY